MLSQINGLQIRDYTIAASGNTATGVIAQELLTTNPDMVHLGEDGYFKVDSYNPWKVLKGIQELSAKQDDIEQRVVALESTQLAQGLWNGGVVTEDTEFAANVTFSAITTFNGQSVFTGGTTFNGPVSVNGVLSVNNSSNSGSVTIPAGSSTVHVAFTSAHSSTPKISATPKTLGQFNFAVQNVTTTGFDIVITPNQSTNTEFDWLAI